MPRERFPKWRRIHQVLELEQELAGWESVYKAAAEAASSEWLQGRFMDRARLLGDARARLRDLVADLAALPRLA